MDVACLCLLHSEVGLCYSDISVVGPTLKLLCKYSQRSVGPNISHKPSHCYSRRFTIYAYSVDCTTIWSFTGKNFSRSITCCYYYVIFSTIPFTFLHIYQSYFKIILEVSQHQFGLNHYSVISEKHMFHTGN